MSQIQRPAGWKYDLDATHHPSHVQLISSNTETPLDNIDENMLEIPRRSVNLRGPTLIIGSLILLATAYAEADAIYYSLFVANKTDLEFIAATLGASIILFAILTPSIRMDIGRPCNEPIRFNRHRRKVYFYQYRFDLLHPFGRKNWGVKPVAYDWDDLTAEAYRIYGAMGYGGLREEVMLSVRKPGTDEVIDRVFLADDIEKGEQYWAIARLFMQQGPEALPDFIRTSKEHEESTNPDALENVALGNPFDRLAPKVQWPTEMDLESCTAPAPGEQP
ncbi:DUF6708 domain-containing protein [Pseudomonas putida]|uniref:DUF6708 domain-containing protein n=1 Tax=Pseudomonas putida TaxID=303 RepID=UPI001E2EEEDC|nr:DUF6708 domain-containing protein [Pseudomonas putida]